MNVNSIKKAILFVATIYAIFFILAIWTEALFSSLFVKLSITVLVIEILLGMYYYFEYWHSDDKKNKKDYFAD